jgi:hypothetical protein
MTKSERSLIGPSIARSAAMPEAIEDSGASGWRRRVSL